MGFLSSIYKPAVFIVCVKLFRTRDISHFEKILVLKKLVGIISNHLISISKGSDD